MHSSVLCASDTRATDYFVTTRKSSWSPSPESAGWCLTAVWTQVWRFVALCRVGTLSPVVYTETRRLQSGQQEQKRRVKEVSSLCKLTHSNRILCGPAAAAELSPPPSGGLCLSPAPPGGHTPAAASCCSPAAPSVSARAQPASSYGPDRAPLAAPSAASESGHTWRVSVIQITF